MFSLVQKLENVARTYELSITTVRLVVMLTSLLSIRHALIDKSKPLTIAG